MYSFPTDFEELTLDGLIGVGAPTNAISKQALNKIKLLASEVVHDTGPALNLLIIVANGH